MTGYQPSYNTKNAFSFDETQKWKFLDNREVHAIREWT
jgi:hypothetical protein